MTARRFYFQIVSASVIESITADTFAEAIAIAAESWMPWWQELEWLNPEILTDTPHLWLK